MLLDRTWHFITFALISSHFPALLIAGLSDEEKKELRHFSQRRKREALGRGTVRTLPGSGQTTPVLCHQVRDVTAVSAASARLWVAAQCVLGRGTVRTLPGSGQMTPVLCHQVRDVTSVSEAPGMAHLSHRYAAPGHTLTSATGDAAAAAILDATRLYLNKDSLSIDVILHRYNTMLRSCILQWHAVFCNVYSCSQWH